MTLPRFLRGTARVIACVTAVGAFYIAGKIALEDHSATPTITAIGGVGLALMVLAALDLDSFEALGIKAKLRDTLADAEDRVRNLDKIIRALSGAAFVQAARGKISHDERRDMVSEFTDALTAMKMDNAEIERLKRPFYGYIALRLWYAFGSIRGHYTSAHLNHLQSREQSMQDGPERGAIRAEFERMKAPVNSEYPTTENALRFRALLEQAVAITPVAQAADKEALYRIAADLADIFDGCVQAGNYTPEALTAVTQSDSNSSPLMRRFAARLSSPPS